MLTAVGKCPWTISIAWLLVQAWGVVSEGTVRRKMGLLSRGVKGELCSIYKQCCSYSAPRRVHEAAVAANILKFAGRKLELWWLEHELIAHTSTA